MRTVVIGPVYPYRGGIAHHTTLLAQALAERVPTQVLSFRRQYPRLLYPGQSDRDPSQQALQMPAEFVLDPLYPWTWVQTARRAERFAAQLAVLPWWTTFWGPAFALLARRLHRQGTRVVYLVHNVLPHEPRPWDRPLARLALSQGQAFVVQTERERQRLLDLLPQAAVQVRPHPTYAMFAAQRLPQAEARALLGLPPDRPVLLFFGIVRPYKGLHALLEALADPALADLSLESPNLGRPLLLVAGEFWQDKAETLALIARLGLQEQVILVDRYIPNEDVPRYFSAADALAAPYIAGTQSGAIQMARGFGLPVISSPRIAEAVASSEGITLADPRQPHEFAAAIAACLAAHAGNPEISAAELVARAEAEWQEMAAAVLAAGQGAAG